MFCNLFSLQKSHPGNKESMRQGYTWVMPVCLRSVLDVDLPILFEQQLDPEATAMVAFPSRDRQAFLAHWSKLMANEAVTVRTILSAGQVAGNIVCWDQEGKQEVGYWLGREFWGKGIATEALRQFLGVIKTRPLYAHVAKLNPASRRVLEKCGFEVIGTQWVLEAEGGALIEESILKLDEGQNL
jgi:RimJ/RimL family protein N-acetyltransferase